MNARRKITLTCAAIAFGAVVAVSVAGYTTAAGLFRADVERRRLDTVSEQAFRSLVSSTTAYVRANELTPDTFTGGDASAFGRAVLTSPDVVVRTVDGNGLVIRTGPGGSVLPVQSTEREFAGLQVKGEQAERRFTLPGGDEVRLVVMSLGGGRGAVQIARLVPRAESPFAAMAWRAGVAAVVVLLLAVVAGWFAAWRITRRLERLVTGAEEVADGGRLDLMLTTEGSDEVTRLGVAFDSVLVRLAAAHEDQRRLVQDANHELRTPLTSLRTNISVLKRLDELPPESRRQLIDDLDGEARELSHLVAELMEFSSERRVDEEFRAVDLPALADRVAQRAKRRSGRDIAVDAEGVVTGRARGLERALTNLVDNAVKFSEGPVEVVLRPNGIRVLDRGPGVAPEERARIFDRFHRATSARSLPGSGLGLAIVHEVATTHGGAVFARGRTGGGAEIGFTL